MATIGQAITQLLRANGVPGPVYRVEGGPDVLAVTYLVKDENGFQVMKDGHLAVAVELVDLRREANPPQPVQHDGIAGMMRDAGLEP
jgi:hypothetical protein